MTALTLSACGLLLDLNPGIAVGSGDASLDSAPVETFPDAAGGADTTAEGTSVDAAPGTDDEPSLDAAPLSDADSGCTPDPAWCDSHCGTGPDNCGEARQCATDCPQSYVCGAGNTCTCQTDPVWCRGRPCGATTDNCGNPITCTACDAGACNPEPASVACASRQCGQATNNCDQAVNCGLFGLGLCADLRQVCLSNGTCCSPNSSAACGNQCGTFATDNCGRQVQCPNSCGAGRVCTQHTCCTPVDPCQGACGVTLTDNCGQTVHCACPGAQECTARSTCCLPQGCGPSCFDSCGQPSASCCVEAGVDAGADSGVDSGSPEAGPPDASFEAGFDSGEPGGDASDGGPLREASILDASAAEASGE